MTVQTPNPTESLQHAPPPGPLAVPARPGFRSGLFALFGGYKTLVATPDLWLLAFVPTLIALFCVLVFGVIAVKSGPLLTRMIFGESSSGLFFVAGLVQVIVTLVLLVLAVVFGFALGKPLSGPALERIVRRVEADLGAPAWPQPSLLQDIGRSLQSTIVALAFSLPLLVLLSLLGFFVPPAVVITFPLQLAVTALAGSWDLCDYPLSIRGVAISERLRFMRRHWTTVLGFGLGLALLSFLPCTLFFVLPAGIVGATQLVVSLERFDAKATPS